MSAKVNTKKLLVSEDPIETLFSQLTFQLNSVGMWKNDENFEMDYISDDIELIFFTEGGSDTTIANHEYHCSKMDVMVLEPYCIQSSKYQGHPYYEYIYVHFSVKPAYLQPQFLALLKNRQVVFTTRDQARISSLMHEMVRENEQKSLGYQTQLKVILQMLCIDLIRKKHEPIIKKQVEANAQQIQLVSDVNKYISEHLCEPLLVDDLAILFQVSTNYLFKSFKKVLNLSPSHYIRSCKINLAKQLLFKRTQSVEEVALKCGYSSLYYFSSAFKAEVTCSPKKYQSMATSYEIIQSRTK